MEEAISRDAMTALNMEQIMIRFMRAFVAVAACAAILGSNAQAGGFKFDELWKHASDEFASRLYKATGSLKICAANEVKPWLEKDVIPAFQDSEKAVNIRESD
ncbi:MAG: hypothetical protein ACLPJY_12590, partial [Rhodomicrobium sp.]